LHAINAVLVFLFLWQATSRLWPAAFVAAAFAMHPLRVESVAWVAERKDVLSAFFGLVTLIAYVKYARESKFQNAASVKALHKRSYYLLALAAYALGLMSKAMLVTWPFLLLLLDFWPLGRFETLRRTLPKLTVEKIPFFAMSFAISVVTFLAQKGGGAVAATSQMSVGNRVLNAFSAFYHYVEKTFWPTNLAIIYPWTPLKFLSFDVLAGLVLLLFGTIVFVLLWKTQPWAGVGWFWLIGLLVPVIGLVQVGVQAWADRYSYLPQIGLFILCVWCFCEFIDRKAAIPKLFPIAIAIVPLVALAFLTSKQLSYWRNTKTLFEHTVAVTRDNPLASVELAGELIAEH